MKDEAQLHQVGLCFPLILHWIFPGGLYRATPNTQTLLVREYHRHHQILQCSRIISGDRWAQ